jgi:hypothetical protein
MSSSQADQPSRPATDHLSKGDRQKIARLVRERANEEVDEYTTLGELRDLARDVVQSKAVRIRIAAPFEAKKTSLCMPWPSTSATRSPCSRSASKRPAGATRADRRSTTSRGEGGEAPEGIETGLAR